MPSQAHPLRQDVLTALRCLRQPASLRSLPLLDNDEVRRGLNLPNPDPTTDDLALSLCERLKSIIEELRPAGKENLEQRDWLCYYVLNNAFRQGHKRLAVQRTLGISSSYFYQLRNQALDNVATLLVARSPAPTVSLAEPIPRANNFVGREAELALYRQSLTSHNLAVIYGFAGAGKTALAAQLASEQQRAGRALIWITFYPHVNTDLDNFLNLLACALAELDDPSLQEFLAASARETQPYPADARIRYAINCLDVNQITLCLDDVQLIESIPPLQRFLMGLAPRQRKALTPLIVTSRREPSFAQGHHVLPLPGMSVQDTGHLLQQTGIGWLDQGTISELHQRTEGNAAFIKFFISWAQSLEAEGDSKAERLVQAQAFIQQLGRSPNSRNFLLDEVLTTLDTVERSVLERMALCRKAMDLKDGTFAALFAGLDVGEAETALHRLEQRSLLMRRSDTYVYRPHSLVQNCVLAQLERSPSCRLGLHARLADYFLQTNEPLEAAFHYCRAGQSTTAVELLNQQADGLIQKGQAAVVSGLAQEIELAALSPEQHTAWHVNLARAWQRMGELEKGLACLGDALEQTSEQAYAGRYQLLLTRERLYDLMGRRPSQQRDLAALKTLAEALADEQKQAEAILRQADYLDVIGDYPAAIRAAQRAVRWAERSQDTTTQATVYLQWGRTLWHLADYKAAQPLLEKALSLAQTPQVKAHCLHNLGSVFYHLDDFESAQSYGEKALDLYRQMGDRRGESAMLNNLGNITIDQGYLSQAWAHYEQALRLRREIGDRHGEGIAHLSLGMAVITWGGYDRAKVHLQQALHIFRQVDVQVDEGWALGSLAWLFYLLDENETAWQYAQQAWAILQKTQDRYYQGYVLRYLGWISAELPERPDHLNQAAQFHQQALALQRELGSQAGVLDSLANLANVRLAQGKLEQALVDVEKVWRQLKAGPFKNKKVDFKTHLSCYRVLQASDDPRAQGALTNAYNLLQDRAARIADKAIRRSFLENVSVHREIVQEWRALTHETRNELGLSHL